MAASVASQIAVDAIEAYQKHLSPHKGFACPHRSLYGGLSCSEYVKQLFTHQDLLTTVQLSVQRFQGCKSAAQILQQSQGGCIVIPCCIPI